MAFPRALSLHAGHLDHRIGIAQRMITRTTVLQGEPNDGRSLDYCPLDAGFSGWHVA
jgi:hypothetical protein